MSRDRMNLALMRGLIPDTRKQSTSVKIRKHFEIRKQSNHFF